MANPFVKPGGASFPVFTNGNSLRAFPWGDKGDDLILVVQFDFAQINVVSGNGLSSLSGIGQNNVPYNSLFIDPRPLFGTRVPRSFKSIQISADFDPANNYPPPYASISIAESSIGQLLYLTNRSTLAQFEAQQNIANHSMDTKASACFDLISQPGATFCLSQSNAVDNVASVNVPQASGVAIFTTFRLQTFFANS